MQNNIVFWIQKIFEVTHQNHYLYGTGEIGFPITIAWTGLAWHAFVVVGVYYFLVFLNSSFKKATLFSMVFGLFWGFWSVFWSLEKDPTLDTSVDALIGHSLIYTFFLILSLFVFSLSISTFKPTSFGNWFVVVVLGLYFLVGMVPIAPQSLLILPLLLGLSYIGLRGFGIAHNHLDILKPKKLFIPVVLMMPLFAIVFSVIFGSFQSNLIFLFLSVPISSVWFFVSLYQAYKSYKNPTGEERIV